MTKDKLIDFSELKFGQLVWDVRYGSVIITKLKGDYPISAITINGTTLNYDEKGYACIGHYYPMLYKSNPNE